MERTHDIDRPQSYLALLGRILLAFIFVHAGIGKLMSPAATIGYISRTGIPLPELAYAAALAIEIGVALAIVLGFQARVAGLLMALFCIATALLFHSNFADPNMEINFMKNIAMAGGFLYVTAFGAGAISLDASLASRRLTAPPGG